MLMMVVYLVFTVHMMMNCLTTWMKMVYIDAEYAREREGENGRGREGEDRREIEGEDGRKRVEEDGRESEEEYGRERVGEDGREIVGYEDVRVAWEDEIDVTLGQEFRSKGEVQDKFEIAGHKNVSSSIL